MASVLTILQTTLVPVASGATVSLYAGAPLGLSSIQATSYAATVSAAASGTTDGTGSIAVSLTAGTTYLVLLAGFTPNYLLATTGSPQYIVISPSQVVCRVTGTVQGADTTPQAGVTVTANLNASGPVITSNLILAQTVTTTTDSNGHWELDLIPNEVIVEPKNTLYTFVFSLPSVAPQLAPFFAYGIPVKAHGASVSRTIEVPNLATADFSSLI